MRSRDNIELLVRSNAETHKQEEQTRKLRNRNTVPEYWKPQEEQQHEVRRRGGEEKCEANRDHREWERRGEEERCMKVQWGRGRL